MKLWWWVSDHFYWKVSGPLKWKWQRFVLLVWCAGALRKYRGYKHDCMYGDKTTTIRGFEHLRALLTLYSLVLGKGAQDTWTTETDVRNVLNMNKKYQNGISTIVADFNQIIYDWQLYSRELKGSISKPPKGLYGRRNT